MKTVVPIDQEGIRLDVFLVSQIPDLSRTSIQKLCDQNEVLVNNVPEKPRYKLRYNDKIDVLFDKSEQESIPNIAIPILYEDDECIVIDKPKGVLTHSKGAFNPEATVATFIQQHGTQMTGDRGGIVHRLDRATSGVMICAKTPEALSWLQKQFSTRKVKKTYVAVIEGELSPDHAVIDMPIERNPKKPQTFRVGVNGRPAQTEYIVLGSNAEYSLIELRPTTGRTHQLRVHLADATHHPIVGDTLYSGKDADRLYLHAHKLEITLPNRKRMTFESKIPNKFTKVVS